MKFRRPRHAERDSSGGKSIFQLANIRLFFDVYLIRTIKLTFFLLFINNFSYFWRSFDDYEV